MEQINLELHYKQGIALTTKATEILYGGAAGGGKSHLLRIAAVAWAYAVSGLQIYIFRRKFPDLFANHMDGPSSFPAILSRYINLGFARINQTRGEIVFWNESKIHLCHCQHEKDVYNYQGAEIHVLMMDELTHFTENQYRFLRNRVRIGGLEIPEDYKGMFPRILCGSNPGSVGHSWVKRTFIDCAAPYDIVETEKSEGGMLRQFIPALLEDNPTMLKNDPDYEFRLEGLGSPDLVKAMRYGLWDITAGAAFEKLSREKHMLRNFSVPWSWTKFMAIDWGYSHPFSVGWYCVCDDDLELTSKDHWPARFVPKGSIIRYREFYGWNGKPNEGCRMDAVEVAKKIISIEEEANEEIDYRIGDSQMWATDNGPSVERDMYDATSGMLQLHKSKKDRITNYQRVRTKIAGVDDYPAFYVTEACKHFWRTMPDLQIDELHPEKGPDTDQEDHCYDEVAYALCTEPPIITESQRIKANYELARRQQQPRGVGRYATK